MKPGAEDDDQQFWWQTTAVPLSRLLAVCEYTEERQRHLLDWYRKYILTALGPRPIRGIKPKFEPCLVFDGSACELSMNWKEREPNRTVRFTIEATGHEAGTPTDPFNQRTTETLLRNMASEFKSFDLSQFEHFAKHFFLPNEAAESLHAKMPADTPLSQVWVAFDLLHDSIMAKVYFIPLLKWIHTGTRTRDLVKQALTSCGDKYGPYDAAFGLLETYIDKIPPDQAPHIEMLAVDCIDSPKHRVKIYLRTNVNTLAKARHAYTLAGSLAGPAVETALAALNEFWPIIFRLEEKDIDDVMVLPEGSGCGYAIEMRPGVAEPEVKIHIPVRKIERTDEQLCDSLAAWFGRRGRSDLASIYLDSLRSVL
jgi:tryptophan 7-dimethylallyltransferase